MSEKMCIHGFPIEFSPRVVQKVLNKTGCPSCLAEKVAMLETDLLGAIEAMKKDAVVMGDEVKMTKYKFEQLLAAAAGKKEKENES